MPASPGSTTLTCTPVSAGGRWLGVIFADRGGGHFTLTEPERHTMWTLGQDGGARGQRADRDQPAGPRAPALGPDRACPRDPRAGGPAAVRHLARARLRARPERRRARALRRGDAGRAGRPARGARAAALAAAAPRRPADGSRTSCAGSAATTRTCRCEVRLGVRRRGARRRSTRSPSPCWRRPCATPTSMPSPTPRVGRGGPQRRHLRARDPERRRPSRRRRRARRRHGAAPGRARGAPARRRRRVRRRATGEWRVRLVVPLGRTTAA